MDFYVRVFVRVFTSILLCISAIVKCTSSPSTVLFRSAVLNAGYRISSTHVNPLGLKIDAPWDVIWDIMRCWVKNHPVKEQPHDSAGTAILSKFNQKKKREPDAVQKPKIEIDKRGAGYRRWRGSAKRDFQSETTKRSFCLKQWDGTKVQHRRCSF